MPTPAASESRRRVLRRRPRRPLRDLVAVLDPDIVLRSDGGLLRPGATALVEGAEAVASRAMTYAGLEPWVRPALVNGVAGVVVAPPGGLFSVLAFTVRGGRVAAIDALADPERLAGLDLAGPPGEA
jgi:RNA polymerase sigma-70 factor (ECF subfamily)